VSAHLRVQLTQSLSVARRRLQRALLLTSVALLFVALAAPLYGYRWELVSRRGNEIVFAVDTSRSMSTPDVKPNRLMRAKLAIDDFSNQLDGDGVGLVAFAGSAFLVCPITLDYGAFHESLNAIDTNTIPRGGTNTASAIREAQAALRRRPGSDKILILVTDGEDLEGDALTAAKAAASEDGLKIYTVGVGTPQGDLIPVSGGANGGFVKDDSGAYVKSRLDESALKAIAAATGGIYAPLGAQGQGLETIYRTALAPMLKHDLASRRQRIYTQRYQWPLAASLCLLILSLLVGNRRRMPAAARRAAAGPRAAAPGPSAAAPGQAPGGAAAASTQSSGKAIGAAAGNASSAAAASLAAAIVLVVMMGPTESRASPGSAEDAYQKGDYAAAAKQYAEAAQRDPKKPVLAFNAGAAAYKAGQYAQAAKAFQQAISRVPSADPKRLAEQEDAYYNLGNTLYRSGQATETSAPQTTLEAWNSALKAYDTALQMRPDDADSKFNRDLVKRKIDELKQNQQNNQGNQNDKNDKNNQNKQSGQSGQSGQNNQPPDQGQKPPQDSGQPPNQQQQPQQPPNQQQPNQPPPQQAQQPPNAQPPPGGQPPAGQPPGQQQQPPPPSANQPANQKPGAGQPKPASEEPPPPTQAESPPAPGQMTQEQARELLDSQKEDERRALGLPYARQEAESSPDTPVKDW
jgi:Ca-activated chloride channel family protein